MNNPPDRYKQFIFESYRFDPEQKTLDLHYSLDGELTFTENFRFDFDFAPYNEAVLDRAMQLLFFLAGSSYYKTYIPAEIVIKSGELDPFLAHFFTKTYERGYGEFWFVNQLPPRMPASFPSTTEHVEVIQSEQPGSGLLVGVGGGKDSLVSVELLREAQADITTWSVGHRPQLTPLIEKIDLPHCWIERTWDRKLLDLRDQGALNGHIPFSGLLACVGIVAAILAGKQDVVVSNEQSANEPDFTYEGTEVNHQYSKSQEFEDDFQKVLQHVFGDQLHYYSFLRPLSEMRIAETFAKIGLDKYKDVFSSCNRAYIHTSTTLSWCGNCPKCAFTYLMLAPFVEAEKLNSLWGGKNLLLDPNLETLYRQLLGIEGGKPLECVGEIKESRSAMRRAQDLYPELKETYQFELPDDYDYAKLHSHHMPETLYQILVNGLQQLDEPRE